MVGCAMEMAHSQEPFVVCASSSSKKLREHHSPCAMTPVESTKARRLRLKARDWGRKGSVRWVFEDWWATRPLEEPRVGVLNSLRSRSRNTLQRSLSDHALQHSVSRFRVFGELSARAGLSPVLVALADVDGGEVGDLRALSLCQSRLFSRSERSAQGEKGELCVCREEPAVCVFFQNPRAPKRRIRVCTSSSQGSQNVPSFASVDGSARRSSGVHCSARAPNLPFHSFPESAHTKRWHTSRVSDPGGGASGCAALYRECAYALSVGSCFERGLGRRRKALSNRERETVDILTTHDKTYDDDRRTRDPHSPLHSGNRASVRSSNRRAIYASGHFRDIEDAILFFQRRKKYF